MRESGSTVCVGNLAWGYVNAFSDHVKPGPYEREAELQQLVREAYADAKARLS